MSPSHAHVQSERAGLATGTHEGGRPWRGHAYRARVPLCCDVCAKEIGVGELFSRRAGRVRDASSWSLQRRVCARCGPLTLQAQATGAHRQATEDQEASGGG